MLALVVPLLGIAGCGAPPECDDHLADPCCGFFESGEWAYYSNCGSGEVEVTINQKWAPDTSVCVQSGSFEKLSTSAATRGIYDVRPCD